MNFFWKLGIFALLTATAVNKTAVGQDLASNDSMILPLESFTTEGFDVPNNETIDFVLEIPNDTTAETQDETVFDLPTDLPTKNTIELIVFPDELLENITARPIIPPTKIAPTFSRRLLGELLDWYNSAQNENFTSDSETAAAAAFYCFSSLENCTGVCNGILYCSTSNFICPDNYKLYCAVKTSVVRIVGIVMIVTIVAVVVAVWLCYWLRKKIDRPRQDLPIVSYRRQGSFWLDRKATATIQATNNCGSESFDLKKEDSCQDVPLVAFQRRRSSGRDRRSISTIQTTRKDEMDYESVKLSTDLEEEKSSQDYHDARGSNFGSENDEFL